MKNRQSRNEKRRRAKRAAALARHMAIVGQRSKAKRAPIGRRRRGPKKEAELLQTRQRVNPLATLAARWQALKAKQEAAA
jgi:hypothetical protein